MKSQKGTIVGVTVVFLCAATLVGRAASPGRDQEPQSGGQTQGPPGPPPPGPGPDRPGRMGMPFGGGFGGLMMSGGAEVVTGAPYSAQAITEITQTLADGNRIVRRVTASVYRDSAGRVRRDQVLAAVGSWMPEDQPKTAIIDDPVTHVHYILNPDRQTAARFPIDDAAYRGRGDKSADSTTSGSGQQDPNAPAGLRRKGPGTVESTALGTQTIEGVQATGTQSVLTIEAGAIGNEQAIRIVSEEWYSEDLKTVVLRKRSDPRFGQMVYQLTQISRTEPDPTLFQVPANYTVTDGGRPGPRFGGGPRPGRRPN